METALLQEIAACGLGLVAGVIGGSLRAFSLARRVRKAEYRLNDIEDRQNQVRAKVAASARWDESKWMKELQGEPQTVPAKRRYDNDPIGE